MQIAVGVDGDGDGTVLEDGTTTDEWHYNVDLDGAPPDVTTTPWRAVRLTITARSITESSNVALYLRPAVEDRPVASSADVYRRRTLTSTVEIRNLTGSQ